MKLCDIMWVHFDILSFKISNWHSDVGSSVPVCHLRELQQKAGYIMTLGDVEMMEA